MNPKNPTRESHTKNNTKKSAFFFCYRFSRVNFFVLFKTYKNEKNVLLKRRKSINTSKFDMNLSAAISKFKILRCRSLSF